MSRRPDPDRLAAAIVRDEKGRADEADRRRIRNAAEWAAVEQAVRDHNAKTGCPNAHQVLFALCNFYGGIANEGDVELLGQVYRYSQDRRARRAAKSPAEFIPHTTAGVKFQ